MEVLTMMSLSFGLLESVFAIGALTKIARLKQQLPASAESKFRSRQCGYTHYANRAIR